MKEINIKNLLIMFLKKKIKITLHLKKEKKCLKKKKKKF